ncbi:hypothetical protein F5883DRAFT_634834 [Diaporthe sp. PMI_573]|nr:hypothetical protein F5883DRAFT_634834 [Diaporthaceae sp. PMI_573]
MEDNHQKENPMAAQQQPQQQQEEEELTDEQRHYALRYLKQRQDQKTEEDKRDIEDRRSRIKEMLAPENRDKPVVIGSRKDYLAMDAAYNGTAGLTAAIDDFSNIWDNPKNKAAGDETNNAVKAVKSLSKLEVQLLAGKILISACDANCGRYNFPSWPKAWKKGYYGNFNLRCQGVCHALAQSKALVRSIMDGEFPFTLRFAVAPEAELKVKGDNGKFNRKRAETTEDMKKRLRTNNDNNGKDGEAAPK